MAQIGNTAIRDKLASLLKSITGTRQTAAELAAARYAVPGPRPAPAAPAPAPAAGTGAGS